MISFIKSKSTFHIIVYTLLVSLTVIFLNYMKPGWIYHYIWILLLFFFILTTLVVWVIDYTYKKFRKKFIQAYFGIMAIRLIISLAFAIIFILKDRENVLVFGINFLIMYLLFLGFEIYNIITNLRTHFKKGIGND